MLKKASLLVIFFLLTTFTVHAQVASSGFGLSLNGGATFPSEDGFKTGFGLNIDGHYYLGSIIADLSFEYDSPGVENTSADFSISGLTGGITLPFAPESGTTPFLKGHAGAFKSKVSDSGFNIESDWKFGYVIGAGFRFMPQQWRNVFIVLEGEYKGISFEESWNSFGLKAGIGFDL